MLSEAVDQETQQVPEWMIEAASERPDAQVERADQQRWLRRQVQALSEDKREVFRLIYDAQVEVRGRRRTLGHSRRHSKSRVCTTAAANSHRLGRPSITRRSMNDIKSRRTLA